MDTEAIELRPIYVNLSAKQLVDNTLTKFIDEMVKKYNVSPKYFGVELTESTLIDNEYVAREILGNLQKIGVKIAIDDFGSGQAGLNYLTKYPVEMVKLDREFCVNYLDEEKIAVFNALVNLAQILGFKVLAEGIEEENQILLLKSTKCQLAQGFYYSRPFDPKLLFEEKN